MNDGHDSLHHEQTTHDELAPAMDSVDSGIPSATADEPLQETLSVCGVVCREGKYLMGKRKPGGALGGKWEFVGGKVNPNEPPGVALSREFLEELGVEISVGRLFYRGSFQHRATHFTLQAYRITLQSDQFEISEHEEIAWIPVPEMAQLSMASSDYGVFEYLKYHPEEWLDGYQAR